MEVVCMLQIFKKLECIMEAHCISNRHVKSSTNGCKIYSCTGFLHHYFVLKWSKLVENKNSYQEKGNILHSFVKTDLKMI